jgi:two-component system, NtrC family, nitrogen regulation response regulator NtrX
VDDDASTLASLSRAFRLAGHEATVCDNASRAVELLRTEKFDLIFSDVVMPGKSGLEFLEEIKSAGVKAPVILISGQANIEMAVRATKLGALDFLEKPLSTDKLLVTLENALRLSRLEDENRELKRRLGKHQLVGSGAAMKKLLAQIDRVAASETRVCILGETGTGKELVARAIHDRSQRRDMPFITLNCAAVPAELIESELFGHEKGAFTGAAGRHIGKFEQAEGGTLFLDEIGDMPVAMQAKLLRVLEESEIERVGGERPVKVNVRVVVATHRNLEELVAQNTFRRDLFHRVYVFPLFLPSLRERPEDFAELLAHFARQVASQNGWKEKEFAEDAIATLQRYSWPGNVRELRNIVERLVLLAEGQKVSAEDVHLVLPAAIAPSHDNASSSLAAASGTLAARTESFEKEVLLAEIRRHNFHMTNVARTLGLERSHLYKKCQQLGIDLQSLRRPE